MAIATIAIGNLGVYAATSLRLIAANIVIVSVGTLLLAFVIGGGYSLSIGFYYLLHSTVVTAALFLIADLIGTQRGSARDQFVTGRPVIQPTFLGGAFLVTAIAAIGLPPLSGFVGKALLLESTCRIAKQPVDANKVKHQRVGRGSINMIKIPTRVLLVDDEKDFVEMLALRLKDAGEVVTVAHSCMECLDLLKTKEIDVVILDILMPGMDGIATLKEIKSNFPLVEVIMLTGHGTKQSAVQSLKLGAFDYLMKPARFEELTAKLEAARQRKDEHEERVRQAEARLLLRKSGNI